MQQIYLTSLSEGSKAHHGLIYTKAFWQTFHILSNLKPICILSIRF